MGCTMLIPCLEIGYTLIVVIGEYRGHTAAVDKLLIGENKLSNGGIAMVISKNVGTHKRSNKNYSGRRQNFSWGTICGLTAPISRTGGTSSEQNSCIYGETREIRGSRRIQERSRAWNRTPIYESPAMGSHGLRTDNWSWVNGQWLRWKIWRRSRNSAICGQTNITKPFFFGESCLQNLATMNIRFHLHLQGGSTIPKKIQLQLSFQLPPAAKHHAWSSLSSHHRGLLKISCLACSRSFHYDNWWFIMCFRWTSVFTAYKSRWC